MGLISSIVVLSIFVVGIIIVGILANLPEPKQPTSVSKQTALISKQSPKLNESKLLLFECSSYLIINKTSSMYSENTPRLLFNGIDVSNGTDFFINKLFENGFNVISDDKNIMKFNGVYLNKNVTLQLTKTPNSDLICYLEVLFNTYDTNSEVNNDYHAILNKLTEKYGECDNRKLVNDEFNRMLDYLNEIDGEYNEKNFDFLMKTITKKRVVFSAQGIKLTKIEPKDKNHYNVLSYIDPVNYKIWLDEYNENKKKSEIDLTNL